MRETLLIIHFIGLAMGLGTSIGFIFLGAAASKLPPEDRLKFAFTSFAMSRMGHIGLGLLVISGFGLMTPHWDSLTASPLLIAKLILVTVLLLLIGMISVQMRKAKEGDPMVHMQKIRGLGKFALLCAITIVVLAVMNFH